MLRFCALLFVSFFTLSAAALADEGMWTFNNFPSAKVQAAYGFRPSAAFLDHVRKAAVRDAGGCSASFISPSGLVMTNHHCVVGCVGQLSTAQHDFVQSGFYAKTAEDERACPDFELDQLTQISDVTAKVQGATAGKTGDAANKAQNAAEAQIQQATCGTDKTLRCDVVSLYHGGIYDLYRYKRYTDVRLVFAPQYNVAQFGGDPDNFNFPRYDFDIGVVRAYENGKPAATPDYLRWSANGSKAGELVFVAGNPGSTSRELTMAQLEYTRDVTYPEQLPALAEYRGILEEFEKRGPEQLREAHEIRFYVENDFKALLGRQRALNDPAFMAQKAAQERKLRAAVAADARLQRADGSAWDQIARLQTLRQQLAPRYNAVTGFTFESGLLGDALTLVESAEERTKPNAQRLPEYTDQALIGLEQQLTAPIPVYPDLEETTLGFAFTKTREVLGTDDSLVKKMLGTEAPDDLAHRLVSGTKLADPAVRKALFTGGQAAITASDDPMIVYARSLDPDIRAIRKDYEARITAPSRAAAERIAKARFAIYGTSVDPDATFTLRLSYGAVKGFDANGTPVAPYTTIAGLYERATGAFPYALPESWLAAKPSLNLATPMNLVTTNDIIGGNSGSPLIDKNGDIVGLIFDGNIYSLGGDFGYDGTRNRAVSVDSRALLEGLSKVYHADRIVSEIEAARHS
ncbi:MAG: S46 family peptidase [Candidatus Eremiobacteraeota bacterium]|nr:S46 family peptidase [Candidatus Eremiobacteraeota bacterium]MBC5802869.1 S46 family peptidase [Candidatus Eremiobacteraeota bacterium]MBC5821532.1 S46 family peptidase [Candidatus Eremiobacteraeota bacterium]